MNGERLVCAAGREADFGGRWVVPCMSAEPRHVLGFGDDGGLVLELRFCDEHMQQLIAAGLIEDPYLDRSTYNLRAKGKGSGSDQTT